MLKYLRNFSKWLLANPLRTFVGCIAIGSITYLLWMLIWHPQDFIANPLKGFDKAILLYSILALGFAFYSWKRIKAS